MKAKNFRIGNFINDTEVNEGYFRIEEIKKNQQGILAVYYRNGSCMSIDSEPIPLTEEILLKCGFDRCNNILEVHDCVIDFKNNVIWIYQKTEDVKCDMPKYLHQLQNLYFALTNEELEVNL